MNTPTVTKPEPAPRVWVFGKIDFSIEARARLTDSRKAANTRNK